MIVSLPLKPMRPEFIKYPGQSPGGGCSGAVIVDSTRTGAVTVGSGWMVTVGVGVPDRDAVGVGVADLGSAEPDRTEQPPTTKSRASILAIRAIHSPLLPFC